jgi:predicted nucleic acid-binding protein
MIAVADASPLNYLVLIGHVDVLPKLFDNVLVPAGVVRELQHTRTPARVAYWVSDPPSWVSVVRPHGTADALSLGAGEAEVLAAGQEYHADVLLIDERCATTVARGLGMRSIGTLGVLALASEQGLLDLAAAVGRLLETNFRVSPKVLSRILAPKG